MKSIKLALYNIRQNFKNAKELKSSFIITIIGMSLNNLAFLFIWFHFGSVIGEVNGWNAMDVFGLYGFQAISYGVVTAFFYGIRKIPLYISTGNLDRFLTTPKNTLLKIATSQIAVDAIGDMLFGLICFIVFAFWAKLSFSALLLSLLLVILACITTFAFTLVCMSISFNLMDGENVSNGLFGMFLSNSLYHGGAFTGVLRIIFTFIIPALLVGAVPVEVVRNMSQSNIIILISISILWFIISILYFYHSLKKYESNNFLGFGS